MSQGETPYLRTSDPPYLHSRDTSGGSGQYRTRRTSNENTETRYIHIADPETYPRGQPTDEPVNTTVNDAHSKDAAGISPELIAQITQTVIEQLKTTKVAETVNTPTTAIPTFNEPEQPVPGSSPTQLGSSPPPRILTPDSPQKHSETHDIRNERLSNDSPSPTRRFRSGSTTNRPGRDMNQKPRAPTRQHTAEEATTLEKIWGKLFDEEGKPTPRLSQFLRGLATHLVWIGHPHV